MKQEALGAEIRVLPALSGGAQAYLSLGGRMNAPMSQSKGKKIPKKNIHPWPFRSVANPSVNNTITYRKAPPIPIAHNIVAPFFAGSVPRGSRRLGCLQKGAGQSRTVLVLGGDFEACTVGEREGRNGGVVTDPVKFLPFLSVRGTD